MKKATVLALTLICTSSAFAESGWKDADGKPVPETESQKSVAGFGGLLVVTQDQGWEKKWNTTPDVAPQLAVSSTVKTGGELFILTMFTNPQLDATGKANVTVDIDVQRPNGSASTHTEGAVCFQGSLGGPPLNVYLCGPVVGFVGEASDPVGTWSVRVTLKDTLRNVSVPLASTFEFLKEQQSSR
jgi:hypothetical protein